MFNCDFWKEKRIGIRCVRQEEVKWGRTMNRKLTLKTLLRVPGVEAFKLQANLVINEGHTRNESSSFRGACFCTESFFARSKVSCTTEEDFWGGGAKGVFDLLKWFRHKNLSQLSSWWHYELQKTLYNAVIAQIVGKRRSG